MNIKEAKQEIKNTLLAYNKKDDKGRYGYPLVRQRPILLMGPPGIGKTAIMEQVSRECGVGLVAYTITHHTRQSAIGLPRIMTREFAGREMSVTEYTLSEIIASVYECMERTGKREGILFIDEINCASETLAPVMLQFLQNKTFGSHRVPEGWMIVAAGNPREYNKSVREFDIVTLDRVRKIDVEADLTTWMEYAWERNVHGGILSYLNIRKEHFYVMENTPEERHFVTARGWEDLSELLKTYEELGVEVTEALMGQFLQQRNVARSFGAYYRLFQEYGKDYGISELLEGNLSEERYQESLLMAGNSGFDERLTVVGLLVDGLNHVLAEYEKMDWRTVLLYERLRQIRSFLAGKETIRGLDAFIAEKRESLRVKEQTELISGGEAKQEQEVLDYLEDYDLILKGEHILDTPAGFDRIRELFEQEKEKRKELQEAVMAKLQRAFSFVVQAYGQGQEMLLLVTCLTRNQRAMKFISAHGCEEFFKYSEELLLVRSERELQEACKDLLKCFGKRQ